MNAIMLSSSGAAKAYTVDDMAPASDTVLWTSVKWQEMKAVRYFFQSVILNNVLQKINSTKLVLPVTGMVIVSIRSRPATGSASYKLNGAAAWTVMYTTYQESQAHVWLTVKSGDTMEFQVTAPTVAKNISIYEI
jgi:asparagine N-glycosylation enzyme membrane subunit Stt3